MIAHATAGPRGAPRLVALHGVGLDRSIWDRCAFERTFRTTRVDLRGHGESGPAAPGVALADLAADVIELLDERVHLVGFSLGGLVAAAVAATRPELARSLALVSCVGPRSADERAQVAARLATAERDLPGAFDAAIARWFGPPWAAREPDLVAAVRATLMRNDRASYLACYRVFATADDAVDLAAISAPTVALTGGEDPGSTPAMSRALAARVADGRAVIVAGARHLLPLERPDAVRDAVTENIERSR